MWQVGTRVTRYRSHLETSEGLMWHLSATSNEISVPCVTLRPQCLMWHIQWHLSDVHLDLSTLCDTSSDTWDLSTFSATSSETSLRSESCRSKKFARNSEWTVFYQNLLKRNARPPWRRIHGSVEDTKLSTNKQHSLSRVAKSEKCVFTSIHEEY
jgi:hypothetical protein